MNFGTERRKRWYLVAAGHLAGASGLAALGVMTCVTPAGAANGPTDPTGPLDQQVTRTVADDGSERAAGARSDMSAASGKADAFRARLRLDHSAPGLGQDLLGEAGASMRAVPSQPSTGPSDEASAGATEAAARVRGMISSFEDRVLAGGFEPNRSRLLAAAWGDDAAAANSDNEASTDARGFGAGDSSARPDGAMDEGATAADGMAEHGKAAAGADMAAAEDGKAEAADGMADAADGKAEHGKADHGKAAAEDDMAAAEDDMAAAEDGKAEAEAPGDELRRFLDQAGDDLADGHGGQAEKARESLLGQLSGAMGERAADDSDDAANAAMGEESMTEDQQGGGFTR
ncbi:hypothetical protein [Actinopolymorpha pittospori]|uniref:Uncharacterized protein n=1 Tax=Actinopolymorpha pittospori TaxID=648752 RepID=A0A927N6R7_9ACTN|nr:hypothetical protein [Actinopolymorpha pittospori]MBE1613184.1 hypothetical protein [Actinopolymorpha pittospori]